jgi:hypothetical protein
MDQNNLAQDRDDNKSSGSIKSGGISSLAEWLQFPKEELFFLDSLTLYH